MDINQLHFTLPVQLTIYLLLLIYWCLGN